MADVRTRCYRAGVVVAEDFPVHEVLDRIEPADATVWVDLVHPADEHLASLASQLGLHELAVEDALEPRQRSKIDRYPDHLFLSCHAVRFDRDSARLDTTEVDAFIGARWLVTVRSSDAYDIEPAVERWDDQPELVAKGAGILVHGLLDHVVDGYFDVVDQLDEYYEELADQVFSEHPLRPDQQRDWFEMRRALTHLHRLVMTLREALSGLVRGPHELADPAVLPYWQDLYDHVLVVGETTDSLRDLVSSLVDANLTLRDYRQNLVMKKVSSWAAIIAVPALITGYYGMNVPFPGHRESVGVAMSTLLIAVASLSLYALFRRRDWL